MKYRVLASLRNNLTNKLTHAFVNEQAIFAQIRVQLHAQQHAHLYLIHTIAIKLVRQLTNYLLFVLVVEVAFQVRHVFFVLGAVLQTEQ